MVRFMLGPSITVVFYFTILVAIKSLFIFKLGYKPAMFFLDDA